MKDFLWFIRQLSFLLVYGSVPGVVLSLPSELSSNGSGRKPRREHVWCLSGKKKNGSSDFILKLIEIFCVCFDR